MTIRSGLKMMLLGLAAMILAAPSAMAWTCNGTLVLASADESTSPGQSCGSNYLDTHVSNDTNQCLQETSSLYHTWRFDNVPAGTISFIREGHRPANADGDNFKFSLYYFDNGSPFFILFPAAKITKNFELQGGEYFAGSHTTDGTYTFYVLMQDTAQEGTAYPNNDQAIVYIDYLAICSEGGGGD